MYDGNGNANVIRDQDKFFSYLLSPRFDGHWLYAHNGSGYDLRYLVAWLCKNKIPWEAFAAGSRWFLRVEGREFLDSMAVLPMSLREAAKKLGAAYQKHEVPADFYLKIESYDWQTYLKGDLLALYECIAIMREAVTALGGQLKRTLASTAVDLWQRVYLDSMHNVPEWNHPAESAAREAYAGGRCEVFKRHIDRGEYWDRNSSYPKAMLTPVPVEVGHARRGNAIPDCGLVYAEFLIPHEDRIPPLFFRPSGGGRLYHPTGTIRGWRTVDEAKYVQRLYGSKSVRVSRSLPFVARDLFSGYVTDLYAKRLVPGPVGVVAKRLLTNLYGRMGMVRERERMVAGPSGPEHGHLDLEAGIQVKGRKTRTPLSEAMGVYLETDPDTMKHNATIMPAIAATITARGRIAWHEQALLAPDLAYGDTDSVVTGGKMPCKESLELGEWKREAVIYEADFIAPKAYRIVADVEGRDGPQQERKLHAKGMPRRDVKLLAGYLAGEPVQVGRVLGIREAMRQKKPVDGPSLLQTRQHIAGGNRHPDGRAFTVAEVEALNAPRV